MKLYAVILFQCLFLVSLGNLITIHKTNLADYDSFIFALQWANNICGARDPACESALARIEKNTMTIRGLWPSMTNGVDVRNFRTEATIQVRLEGLTNYPELHQVWPSLTSASELNLWTHEYNNYGKYFVLRNRGTSYSLYFKAAVTVFNMYRYKTLFQRAFGREKGERLYSANELYFKIAMALGHPHFKMICQRNQGQQRITQLYVSLGLSFEPLPAKINGIACQGDVPILVKFR